MANNVGDTKKNVRTNIRSYLNRDFDQFREAFFRYARTYYKDKIQDFSESSFGGLMMELAAYVGDAQAFYLDHMFHELDLDTARESASIERLLRKDYVPIVGASPSVVEQDLIFTVPATNTNGIVEPDPIALPVVRAIGTILSSQGGVSFELTEDVDFTEEDGNGNLLATVKIATRDQNGIPTSFNVTRQGVFISGKRATETFQMGAFQPYFKYILGNANVTEILSVLDDLGNEYFEVGNLAEDTVFRAVPNLNYDGEIVKNVLVPFSALYRLVTNTDLNTRQVTLTFGGGDSTNTEVTTLVDPASLSIPLYGKRVFNRIAINPNSLLNTKSQGIATPNSTYTVTYRYGGGLQHNAQKETIRDIQSLNIEFPNSPSTTVAQKVRASADTINRDDAKGGDDAPSIDVLKRLAPFFRASQNRVVNKEDLIARVYTLPSNFGRVFRATVHPVEENPLSSALYILSRDSNGHLALSSDTLKKNLKSYLKSFRLTTDAVDILDARIVNIGVSFKISVDPGENRNIVILQAINKLSAFFDLKKFEIDQPIVKSDIHNLLYNTQGVLSVVDIQFTVPVDGSGRDYSEVAFDPKASLKNEILFPPKGGIFEIKYPTSDIVGLAV